LLRISRSSRSSLLAIAAIGFLALAGCSAPGGAGDDAGSGDGGVDSDTLETAPLGCPDGYAEAYQEYGASLGQDFDAAEVTIDAFEVDGLDEVGIACTVSTSSDAGTITHAFTPLTPEVRDRLDAALIAAGYEKRDENAYAGENDLFAIADTNADDFFGSFDYSPPADSEWAGAEILSIANTGVR